MLKLVFDAIDGYALPDNKVQQYVDEDLVTMIEDDIFTHTMYIGQQLILDAVRVKIKEGVDVSKLKLVVLKDGEEIPVPIYQNGRIGDWSNLPEVYTEILSKLCL